LRRSGVERVVAQVDLEVEVEVEDEVVVAVVVVWRVGRQGQSVPP
jgi:hypothetical protein